jgi:hypothetical protein
VYGVDPDTDLRMPFNRADYFIVNANIPKRCAPNTGILEKAVVNQNGGGFNFLPLLDCVADMQVIFRLDMNSDGMIGTITNADGSSVISSEGSDSTHVQAALKNAAGLRDHLKEMRVYVLAHEGQKDSHYAYPDKTITVGEPGAGRTFPLETTIGKDWQHYRWKVYTIAVQLNNLR